MMNVTFSPKLRMGNDVLEQWLLTVAQSILVAVIVVLPVLFLPHNQLSLGFTKSFLALAAGISSLIVFSLFVLRIGMVRIVAPVVQVTLWSVALFAVASALLSGDRLDALVGDTMQIQTAAFLLLIALITSATALILDSKTIVLRFFLGFAVVAGVLQLWHILRLFLGPNFLSFGIFSAATVSPLGSFNDVAIFAGLTIVLSIIGLLQLPLRGAVLGFVGGLIATSLMLLAVINFSVVWLVVGFFALLVLLYSLTRDRLLASVGATERTVVSPMVLGIVGTVCAFAAVFIVAGTYLGTSLSNALDIQYLEVRPSFSATLDIVQATYENDNALLGVGPNRFEDAWRQYKSPVINETLFWNTSFTAGSGYVLTLFVTIGIVGGILMFAFLISLGYVGYRMLATAATADSFWYFTGTASFAAAAYLWGMAVVYVPGATLLILAAFFSGLSLVALAQLVPQSLVLINFTNDRARAFMLIATVMVAITAGVGALFMMSKQFAAHVVYAEAVSAAAVNPDPVAADAALLRAQSLHRSDLFIIERVRLRLPTLSTLLATTNPSSEDQARFQTAAVEALALAGEAVTADPTSPVAHALLGSVYGLLAIAGVENAQEMAAGSLSRARELDPQNPEYPLVNAQIATRLNNLTRARELVEESVAIKRNYVDALYLLSQLDVAEGNTEAAVETARSIISIEPQNPSRHFQLGALLLAARDLSGATAAFENAIQLDPNFANARYLLALVHLEQGKREAALTELTQVAVTNPDNTELKNLIASLEAGESINAPLGITPPVTEPAPVSVAGDGVTTSETAPETDLIVPVNRTSSAERSTQPTQSAEGEAVPYDDVSGEDVVSSE